MGQGKSGIGTPAAIGIVVVIALIIVAIGYKLFMGSSGNRVEDKTTTFQRPAPPNGPPMGMEGGPASMQGSMSSGGMTPGGSGMMSGGTGMTSGGNGMTSGGR